MSSLPWDRKTFPASMGWGQLRGWGARVLRVGSQDTAVESQCLNLSVSPPRNLPVFSSISQGSHSLPPRLPSGSDAIWVRRVASTGPGMDAAYLVLCHAHGGWD